VRRVFCGVLLICFFSSIASAEGQLRSWTGVWDLNVDGIAHELAVQSSDRTCNETSWCAIDLVYRDQNGKVYPARIVKMERPDAMVFDVKTSDGVVRFYAYQFSRDLNRLAGVTKWGGKVRGFSGVKR
jgi:hypothetical protein